MGKNIDGLLRREGEGALMIPSERARLKRCRECHWKRALLDDCDYYHRRCVDIHDCELRVVLPVDREIPDDQGKLARFGVR